MASYALTHEISDNETCATQTFSSECNEILPGLATHSWVTIHSQKTFAKNFCQSAQKHRQEGKSGKKTKTLATEKFFSVTRKCKRRYQPRAESL